MASTAPVKSQALHNFALSPSLKWKNNHPRAPSRSQSPMREVLGKGKGVVDSKNRDLDSFDDCDQVVEKAERKSRVSSEDRVIRDSESKECRSKLLIRIPGGVQRSGENKGRGEADEGSADGGKGEEGLEGGAGDEMMGKIWNLRPRKAAKKSLNVNGGGGGVGSKVGVQRKSDVLQKGNVENGSRVKVGSDVNGLKKDRKVKFSVSLTTAEIEEDVFSFTGSKPSRRPRKRAKLVQKQMDNLFPGLWLASITPDTYKVSEN